MTRVPNVKVYDDDIISQGGLFGGERSHRGLDHSLFQTITHQKSPWFTPWAEGEIVHICRRDIGPYGRYIEILDDEGVLWSYCHAERIADELRINDRVTFTTPLGKMGSSGTTVPPGSEHLHTMCSRHRGAALDNRIDTFDPLAHIDARVDPARRAGVLALIEGDSDMFQYSKKSGSRFFVHPSLRVRRIHSGEEWSANVVMGIRTERGVDNTKAEVFRKFHNQRARALDASIPDVDDLEDAIEAVLDRMGLEDDIASSVSDAVYDRVSASGPLDEAALKKLAADIATALGGAVPGGAAPPIAPSPAPAGAVPHE